MGLLRNSDESVNAAADGFSVLLDSGYLRIYDGVQPETADTALTTQIMLAQLRFATTAFGSAAGGELTASAITPSTSDNATGTPTNGGVWIFAREFGETYDHNFADLSGGGKTPIGINTAIDSGNRTGELYLTPAVTTNFTVGSFVKGGTSLAVGKIVAVAGGNLYLCAVRNGPYQTSETLIEYSDRECQNALDGSTTNSVGTAFTNVVAGYTDILTCFVQRKFTGGSTTGAFVFGETVTQDTTGATFKFIADVGDEIYVEDLNPTGVSGTDHLDGAGGVYTPTSQAVETEVELPLYPGATSYPYNGVMNLNGKTTTQGYEWSKYITRYGATALVNGDTGHEYRSAIEGTYTDVKVAPFGTLAGATVYAAQGIFLDDTASPLFVLTDADGQTRLPPNYQRVTCSHTSLTGCNVFVATLSTDPAIIKDQYTFNSTASDATHLVVNEAIDINKTPLSGIIRVGDNQYPYSAFVPAIKSFTISVTCTCETSGADLYVPLLDVEATTASEQSDQVVVSTAFSVRTVVRKYGFKPYSADTAFGDAGLTFSPILVSDPQATT